jgi:hypothetical protein
VGNPLTPNLSASLKVGSRDTSNLYFLLLMYGRTWFTICGLFAFIVSTLSPILLKLELSWSKKPNWRSQYGHHVVQKLTIIGPS